MVAQSLEIDGYDDWKTTPDDCHKAAPLDRLECTTCGEEFAASDRCMETADVLREANEQGWDYDYNWQPGETVDGTCAECVKECATD